MKSNSSQLVLLTILSCISGIFLFHGFSNLITDGNLPVDLALRYWQTKDLIEGGINIYSVQVHAQYPPSFYFFLTPFMLFTPYSFMDELWALMNFFFLLLSVFVLFRLQPFAPVKSKLILCSAYLGFHSIALGLGVGQVSVFIVSCILLALYLGQKKDANSFLKILASVLLGISLGKYSLLIPFVVVLLISKQLRWITLGAILMNVVFSWVILSHVDSSVLEYVQLIVKNSSVVMNLGTLDVQAFVNFLGLPKIFTFVLMLFLLLSLLFILQKFTLNLFDQLALASLIARLFIYHAHYDNVILVFILIALWLRLSDQNHSKEALVTFLIFLISMIIPARFLDWGAPYYGAFLIFQLIVWLYSIYFILKTRSSDFLALAYGSSNPEQK